jgi:hypothetical protein
VAPQKQVHSTGKFSGLGPVGEALAVADHAPGATKVQFLAGRSLWQVCSACVRVSPFTRAVKAAFLPCATRTTSA